MTKRDVRDRIWNLLNDSHALRFPGPLHGIPNFEHADRAARRLRELAVWRRAAVVKVCADVPQLFVRRLCIEDGKLLYIAVPTLRSERCFIEVDPERLGSRALIAASLPGACKYGRPVPPREMRPIDLFVCGSLAVSRDGTRVGKGGGYADLEYALLREEGKVRDTTPIATTVHPLQILSYRIAMQPHDVPVDFVVTPTEVIATRCGHTRPRGIYWDLLSSTRINTIPLLRKRFGQADGAGRPSPRRL
jgi:5-formyltetrahydrofolate cyclo-ligase